MHLSPRLLALPVVAFTLFGQAPTGIDLGAIDRAASPCNDFYQYACGTWMKNNPIPPDQSTWGRFAELIERNREILRNILEKASVNGAQGTAQEQKIGDEYASCMNTNDLDAKGISPIQPSLDRIAKLSDKSALATEVARENELGFRPFFRLGSGQDAKDATKTIAQLAQG